MTSATPLNRFTRLFVAFAVMPLLFIAGVQLFILSEQTELYFAWTIPLPLTAAFMGAGYWAALASAIVTLRSPNWEGARASLPASFAATGLLLVTTLLHLDKFHLNSSTFITRFVTWVWIIVYIVTPPVFLYFLVTRYPKKGRKEESQRPFPGWVRGGLFAIAAFGLISGIGLFFFHESFMPLWPWPLMPLASRAIGAWMITIGTAAGTLAWENEPVDGAGTLASLLALCVLQFVVVFRYPSSLDFANPMAWGYILFLLIGLVASGAGLLRRN